MLDTLLSLASSAGALNEKCSGDGRSGGACCAGDVGAVFRVMDGGRDERNRPGRRVVAFLICNRSSLLEAELGSMLESAAFKEVSDLASQGGRLPDRDASRLGSVIRPPLSITGTVNRPRLDPDGRFTIDGRNALASVSNLMRQFPSSTAVAVCFAVTAHGCSGRLCSQSREVDAPQFEDVRDGEFVQLEVTTVPTASSPPRGQGVVSPVTRTPAVESFIRKTLGTSIRHTLGAFLIVGVFCLLVGVMVGFRVGKWRSAANPGEQINSTSKPVVSSEAPQPTNARAGTPSNDTEHKDDVKIETTIDGPPPESPPQAPGPQPQPKQEHPLVL